MEEIKVYTVQEVAALLKVTTRTVYKYVEGGTLRAVKIGKYWRVTDDNLRAFLANGTEADEATVKADHQ